MESVCVILQTQFPSREQDFTTSRNSDELRMIPGSLCFFGSLTIDDHVFTDGSTLWGVPGGNAAYAALGASIWSRDVSMITPVGGDYPVELLQGRVDMSRCRPLPHTLRNWGLHEEDGRRHFMSRSSSRNWGDFCPKPSDVRSGFQAAAHLAAMPRRTMIELTKELRASGTSVISLDLDNHDFSETYNLKEVIALINAIDVFLPSWQDAVAIAPAKEPVEVLWHLRRLAPEPFMIAIKCGADGVIAHIRGTDEWIHVPSAKVQVADATGAGDAFCGGLLAALVRDGNPIESLLHGTVSASLCIERHGLEGLLSATGEQAMSRLEALRPLVSRGRLPGGRQMQLRCAPESVKVRTATLGVSS